MSRRRPLDSRKFQRVNRKVLNFVRRKLPTLMLEEFIKNTPRGETGNASKRSNNKLKIKRTGFSITGDYAYSGVLDRGEFPNPPKKGTGKTFNGYSTQALDGMSEPTLDYGNRTLANYIKRVQR